MTGNDIASRLSKIRRRIESAALRTNRDPHEIQLIAVSKGQPAEKIRKAFDLGLRHFGENYVQEATAKQIELRDLNIQWHFIGGLQSNKAKQVVGAFEWIHSVDRASLLERLNGIAQTQNTKQKILIEVLLADESSKSGAKLDEAESLIRNLHKMDHLIPCGLMVMPPALKNPEEVRPYFNQAKSLLSQWRSLLPMSLQEGFKELSMGTSHDFEIAIEEGSSFVRIGTALMGERV